MHVWLVQLVHTLLTRHVRKVAIIKLPNRPHDLTTCMAVIGSVGNSDHNLQVSGKAGRSRWLGRRPRVRGVVMNQSITQWVVVKEERQVDTHVHVTVFQLRATRP